jgi:hypothetical protein
MNIISFGFYKPELPVAAIFTKKLESINNASGSELKVEQPQTSSSPSGLGATPAPV